MATNEEEAGQTPEEEAGQTPDATEESHATPSQPKAMTAGQRLAAKKAAKAAKKAAQRGRDAELVEDKALERAAGAATWMQQNRNVLTYGVGGALLLALALVAYSSVTKGAAQDAAGNLWEGVEAAEAPIRDADAGAPSEDAGLSFTSESARDEATLHHLRAVTAEHDGTSAAHWSRLVAAATLMNSGDAAGAREAYQQVLTSAGDDPALAARALEGLGFSYEAESDWDHAIEKYEELGNTDGEGNRERADYHLARMYLEKGDEVRAKEKLRALSERLREDEAPELPYLRDQADLLLAQLDPSTARHASPGAGLGGLGGLGGPAGGGAGGMGSLSPEQIQQLIERLQKQQGAGGPPGLPVGGAPPSGEE